eukprot:TRINITY_DN7057_c0_g1_i1.p1 TRINITY_DN7057_c0_g1~~TRINITY_DN7057_c0_g1_i1.p1  ORF type:complete len:1102 (-),score=294.74 TRINITY_DN7057_c0_g1_i1:121-3426(-)
MNEYPDEIRQRPLPVIGLLGQPGLQPLIVRNLSRVAVEGSASKETKPCFQTLTWDFGYLFLPPRKPQKQTYEGYIVQGIQKSNWMLKHTSLLPAVMALFFTHQPDDKNWKAKELEIGTNLDIAKNACRGRMVKFLIVLVQNSNGDQYDERFSVLKKRAELSDKSFFIFNSEDVKGSVKRLEKVLNELASAYYREEARRLKKVKDLANRKTQPQLFVRLNFKIAFFAEFRQDSKTSLKYYQKAYIGLRDVLRDKKNTQEVKVLADYINFKICKTYITMGNALGETVSHFNAHIRTYKNSPRPAEREYEHWAWVARQYQVFGELLDMYAPNLALMSTGLLHPGYYYHAAASYATERKKHAKRLIANTSSEKLAKFSKDSLLNSTVGLYIGQEPDDITNDESNLKALAQEARFDHSTAIIQLLTKAYDKYKMGRLGRMILYLASEMAQEYFNSEKYKMAKKFFDRIAITYRKEKWWFLLTHILRNAATTALKLNLPEEYIEYCLQLLQPYMHTTPAEKKILQQNMLLLLYNPAELATTALTVPMNIEMTADTLLSAKVRFLEQSVHANKEIDFEVQLISHFPLPIRFSRLLVPFNNKHYDCEVIDDRSKNDWQRTENIAVSPRSLQTVIVYSDIQKTSTAATTTSSDSTESTLTSSRDLLLVPEVPYIYGFKFFAKRKEDLSCTGVLLELGKDTSTICFRWNFVEKKEDEIDALTAANADTFSTVAFNPAPHLKISEPEAKLVITAEHNPPALVNEYYRFDIKLTNESAEPIQSGLLLFEIIGTITGTPEATEETFFYGDELEPIRELPIDRIEGNSSKTYTLFIFSPTPNSSRSVLVKAIYETETFRTSTEKAFEVAVELPFDLKSSFYTSTFQAVAPQSGSIISNESFLMCVEIQSISKYPLQITKAIIVLSNEQKFTSQSSSNVQEENAVLNEGDKFTVWFNLQSSLAGNEVSLGTFRLEWKRKRPHGEDEKQNEAHIKIVTETLIPPLKIVRAPFSTVVEAPPHGVVGVPFTFMVEITNHTHRVEDFTLSVKENDAFLFAGTRQSTFKILPLSCYTFKHNLLPITAGKVPLPNFQVTSKRFSRELTGTKQSRYVFIRPSQ